MLFDLAAWTLVIVVAFGVGAGALTVLGARQLRRGDFFILSTWVGVVVLSLALLGTSVFGPLSPPVALLVTGVLLSAGALAAWRVRADEGRRVAIDAPVPRWAIATGIAAMAIGAAALASDRVTLYDALVYHVGIIRWLSQHGTVPGLALIHTRLAHVSAWFTLGAVFDAGVLRDRTANVPLGLALVLVALQASVAGARIVARRAAGPDWFLGLASVALIWAGVAHNAATPSPDVVTNVLIFVVAWSMLLVPRLPLAPHRGWRRYLTPRLIPFVLAVGASGMKLFAIPAAIVAALFYVFARSDDHGTREAAWRAAVCTAVGVVLLAPFVAANIVASGCPLFPSGIGCIAAPWSIGTVHAEEYATYIRNVARWESRSGVAGAAQWPWIGTWIGNHPTLATLAVIAPIVALVLLRGRRRDGVRSTVLLAVLGIAFAGWEAPAPRFLYAFVLIAPLLAMSYPLSDRVAWRANGRGLERIGERGAAALGFVTTGVACGLAFAVASQKVNVLSSMVHGAAPIIAARADLLLPAAPERPARLYRWRVNDVDLVTPVPRPIADTLGYQSSIDGRLGFEKCSTAPLPCTPYLPLADVRLRRPERGLSGGFMRVDDGTDLTTNRPRCVGELPSVVAPANPMGGAVFANTPPPRCGDGVR